MSLLPCLLQMTEGETNPQHMVTGRHSVWFYFRDWCFKFPLWTDLLLSPAARVLLLRFFWLIISQQMAFVRKELSSGVASTAGVQGLVVSNWQVLNLSPRRQALWKEHLLQFSAGNTWYTCNSHWAPCIDLQIHEKSPDKLRLWISKSKYLRAASLEDQTGFSWSE